MSTYSDMADDTRGGLGVILWTLAALLGTFALLATFCGCAYEGGKVVDGTNFAIGITVPGTEWQFNLADYVGGLCVAGNDQTCISVTNEVRETNSYFGVVETRRSSRMSAAIRPCGTETNVVTRR